MKKILLNIFILSALLNAAGGRGREIMQEHYSLPKADTMSCLAIMMLVDNKNNKKMRQLKIVEKDTADGKNSFIEFLSPAEVKGTKFLTYGYDNEDDEQRLFLPDLNKITRIKSSGKGKSFMGSDLNYYDMETKSLDDSTYKFRSEETIKNRACYIVTIFPQDKDVPYQKMDAWVAKDNYFIYKYICYDKNGRKYKTITFSAVKKIKGVLIAARTKVHNHLDQHLTLMKMDNIKVNQAVNPAVFSIKNLK
ncbi:MAG TPA: outer membrane lipoprotein-sorting protein [Spirochaetota bacterium]|nr:outer membrane lipoprotein-sorting protein [Spirochaetota bacterium]